MTTHDDTLPFDFAGETLTLCADRTIWWAARRTLLVADVHLGKGATFRALGQPVPAGTTLANLKRLDSALTRWPVERLIVLGDLLHGPHAQRASIIDPMLAWRARHEDCSMLLVRGNHDDSAGDPPASLRMEMCDEPFDMGPFALCHTPRRVTGRAVLAGHVHPAVVLRGRARDRMRLPCFVFDEDVGLLPAFGEFTGHYTMDPAPGRDIVAVAGDALFRIPAERIAASG